MNNYVYLYEDPRSHTPRYVGKGSQPYRMTQHLNKTHNGNLAKMIIACRSAKIEVVPEVLCSGLSTLAAKAVEIFWIAAIGRGDKSKGPLFNGTDGGDGVTGRTGFKMVRSQQWKDRQSAAQSGRKQKPEHIEAMRKSLIGKNKGRVHTRVECPHCHKVGACTIMKRWHFDNCKEKT